MATVTNEERALKYVQAFERAGKVVRRVIIEGKRVEVELATPEKTSTADLIDWK